MREITDPQLLALLESGDLPEHPMARYGPAVRHVESRGNPNATSPAGAMGADQFMPATARAMGLTDPRDPVMSGVARDLLLAENYDRFKDPAKALAAYNAGPTVVASGRPLPRETQDYVPKVLSVMGIRSAQAAEQPRMREVTDPELIAQLEGSAKPVTLSSTVAKQATGAPKESLTAKAAREEFESMPFYQQFAVGGGQAVNNLLNTGKRALGMKVEDNKEIDDQIGGWGTAGNVAGEIALTALPGGAAYKVAGKVLPKAAGMVPRAIVGGGAAGATSEAMMGRDATEGAGVGAVLGPVGYYGAKGANAVVNELLRMKGGARGRAVESTQDMFKKGDRLEQTIKDLENTTPIVAGERPTAGLAATAATPELAVMEAGARSRQNANLFTQADEATAAARQRAVGQVALPATPRTDIVTGKHLPTTAQAFRTRGSENFYDQAMTDIVPIDRKVARVLNAPDIQAATRDAFDDFQTAVRNASAQGERAPARGKWNQDRGFYETMSIDQLQRISKQIDARLASDPKNFNLNQARQVLQDTMNQSDNYNLATIIFKERSKGVNQSEVAQQLLEKLDSPKQYLNAMKDPKMLLKAAKVPRAVKTLDEVYLDNRGNLQTLRLVGQSLKRQKKLAEMKTAQGIVPRFMSPAEQLEQKLPNWLNAKMTALRSVLKTVGRRSDEAVQNELDVAMSDPRSMAALLKELPPTERNEFVNALRGIVGQEGMLQYGIGPATGQLQEGLN